jgi:hypothetical protein
VIVLRFPRQVVHQTCPDFPPLPADEIAPSEGPVKAQAHYSMHVTHTLFHCSRKSRMPSCCSTNVMCLQYPPKRCRLHLRCRTSEPNRKFSRTRCGKASVWQPDLLARHSAPVIGALALWLLAIQRNNIVLSCGADDNESTAGHHGARVRSITETNRTHFTLIGMQNRASRPYLMTNNRIFIMTKRHCKLLCPILRSSHHPSWASV